MVKASKEKEARQLRTAGASYRAIAGQLSVPLSTVFRWCSSAAGAPLPKAAGKHPPKDVKAAPATAVPVLNALDDIWSEFDRLYLEAQARGQTSQQIRMLLSRAETLRRQTPMEETCVGHMSRQLYMDRIDEARHLILAVIECELRIHREAGCTSASN